MGVPEIESCTDWGWGNGENSLVTMDSARKDGRGITGQTQRPGGDAKQQEDPWGPADTRRGEKRSQVQGKGESARRRKHPTFGVEAPCVIRPQAKGRGGRVHIIKIGPT